MTLKKVYILYDIIVLARHTHPNMIGQEYVMYNSNNRSWRKSVNEIRKLATKINKLVKKKVAVVMFSGLVDKDLYYDERPPNVFFEIKLLKTPDLAKFKKMKTMLSAIEEKNTAFDVDFGESIDMVDVKETR